MSLSDKINEERESPTLHTLSDDISSSIPTYKVKEWIKIVLEIVDDTELLIIEKKARIKQEAGKELI